MAVCFSPYRIFQLHLCIILFLALASLLGHVIHITTGDAVIFGIRRIFNMDIEKNIPSLFSAFAIFCSSVVLFVLYQGYRKSNKRGWVFFLVFGFLFLCLTYDEMFSVHERLAPITRQWITGSGLLFFTWIVPGSLFVLVVFLCSLSFLRHTDSTTRNRLILSGAIFTGGALGFEALGGLRIEQIGYYASVVHTSKPDLIYFLLMTCEETMEMVGIALFLYTLLRHFERNFGTLTVNVGRMA
ncbi:MAG: hypothetical protein GKS00_29615 [Alphaproteobacteria bacterium]|nr:hypothetical protein [Alphaproteobacteria bacterium]